MIMAGKVTGSKRASTKNGRSQKQAIFLQVQFAGGDRRWVQYVTQAGLDSLPPVGAVCVCSRSGATLRFVTAVWDQVPSTAQAGEVVVYSATTAGRRAIIYLKADGSIELNGSTKHLVTWDELNSALQAHTHSAGALVSPTGPVTGSTGTPIALNLASSKTITIKTGG